MYGFSRVTDGFTTPPGTDLGTKNGGGEGVLEGETIIGETAKPAHDTVYVPKDYLRELEDDNAALERAHRRERWQSDALAWALFVVSLMLLVTAWLATWNVVH